jgi:hypothetical protein
MHVKVFHFKTLYVKYLVCLSVLKFEDTWYGRKLRHVCALITAGNGVDATRIQVQNILSELFPVHKAVPTSRTCSPDRRRRLRVVLEHDFHPKALLAYHHPARMRVQAFDSSRPLARADEHIYKRVKDGEDQMDRSCEKRRSVT